MLHTVKNHVSYTNHAILSEAVENGCRALRMSCRGRIRLSLEIDNRYIAEMAGRGLDPQVIENTRIVKDNQIHGPLGDHWRSFNQWCC